MSDLEDNFEDESFDDEDQDAKLADEAEKTGKSKASSLEKRRLIDNLLEEKRLERELDDLDDDLDHLDDDFDDDSDNDFNL